MVSGVQRKDSNDKGADSTARLALPHAHSVRLVYRARRQTYPYLGRHLWLPNGKSEVEITTIGRCVAVGSEGGWKTLSNRCQGEEFAYEEWSNTLFLFCLTSGRKPRNRGRTRPTQPCGELKHATNAVFEKNGRSKKGFHTLYVERPGGLFKSGCGGRLTHLFRAYIS